MKRTLRTPRIGRELKAARALLGWSQTQLAEAAGLHPKSVAYWEQHGMKHIGGHAVRTMTRALLNHGLLFIDGGMMLVDEERLTLSRTDEF